MSMYNLDSNNEDLEVQSHRSPTLILQDVPLLGHLEEVHSSPVTEKIPSERHSMIQEEENPSSYIRFLHLQSLQEGIQSEESLK